MTSDNKHFVTILHINGKVISAKPSTTPLNINAIGFSWWELLLMVIKFQSLTVVVQNAATPFAEGRMKGVLGSLQFVPVRRLEDVQSKESKTDYSIEERVKRKST